LYKNKELGYNLTNEKGVIFVERKIKVVQYGAGKMSVYTMRYVYEKGAEIVGAIDVNPDVIGKDIGEIMGTEAKGVKVVSVEQAESMLQETKPDVAIVTTMSLMSDVRDALMLCAKLGINAITTCEEAFYPMNSNPSITKELDEIAKQTGCTITGSGYQDIYWGQLISSIAGSTQTIKKIVGSSSYNVEDYGIALAEAHGAGLTLEEFDKQVASLDRISDEERQAVIDKGEYLPSYMWNVNGWLCAKLGLTVTRQTQKTVPQTYQEDIESSTLGMTVKAGMATGMSAVVTTETQEGITIESQCIGKVYSKEDFDKNEWSIEGEPNTTLIINRPSTVELTCASVVNRIPDVINSKAGYVPTEEMGELNYRIKPLNEYVN
jgi:4-hydroxy-tetrahydrodipicolinate reductase